MPNDEKMSINERRKYMKLTKPRYIKAGRRESNGLLTEMGDVTGMHLKSLIRSDGYAKSRVSTEEARVEAKAVW
ncbi:hypothetical protein ACFLXA_06360 [Chloroflexota bacterium]